MLKVLSGLAIIAVTATTASAADLAFKTKAPAAAPVAFTWTGCHVGGHVGAAVSQDTNYSIFGGSVDYGSTGFVGGGQIGCDYQFASNWIIGAEGRAAWSSLDDERGTTVRFPNLFPAFGGVTVPARSHTKNDFLASATARLGYVYAERWLVYARGGAAWTHEKVDDSFIRPLFGTPTDPSAESYRTGWTAGAGVEWMFASHWSTNIEYNYYDFGTKGMQLTSPTNTVTIGGLKDIIHTATVGVNYHF